MRKGVAHRVSHLPRVPAILSAVVDEDSFRRSLERTN